MDWDLKLGRVMDEGEASVERTARRRRTMAGGGGPAVTCLVDGCTWDLSNCREYHRRHRVCERHSKTPVVLVSGEEQRFCQQCSRFHSLGEFDEAKRSCRKRLDGHNRRRRKTNPQESIYTNSSCPAATTTPPAPTFLPPPPLFQPLIRHPPLPPSTSSWPVVGPSYPFLPPPQPSPSFGYLSRHNSNGIGRERGEVGHIDCALSLLSSSGTQQQQQQQQQQQHGFGGGVCSTSGSHGGAAHCYAFDDDDDDDVQSHGAPCRMFPFTWD